MTPANLMDPVQEALAKREREQKAVDLSRKAIREREEARLALEQRSRVRGLRRTFKGIYSRNTQIILAKAGIARAQRLSEEAEANG